jgi:hypothetical protein
MVSENINDELKTAAMVGNKSSFDNSFILNPFISICPLSGSIDFNNNLKIVDFPEPLSPTIA